MIPQRVASLRDLSRKSRKRAHTLANLKKSRAGVILGKQVEQAGVTAGLGPSSNVSARVVWGVRHPDRRPKKLRGGRYGGPREYPGGRCTPAPASQTGNEFIRSEFSHATRRIGQRNENGRA